VQETSREKATHTYGKEKRDETKSARQDKGTRYLVILTLTGFSSLALEMVWMRMMLLTINNTIYLSAIVITVFLSDWGSEVFSCRRSFRPGSGPPGRWGPSSLPPRVLSSRGVHHVSRNHSMGFSDFDFYRT
jgi:hypothetical protein